MTTTHLRSPARFLALLATGAVLAGCDGGPLGPAAERARALAELKAASARYQDVNVAIQDGFILLHECEVRPGEGAVGILYVHLERFMDGELDPKSPDGLIYEPRESGDPELVGVEVAMPRSMWDQPEPPEFLGTPLQVEEEFDAFGLHIWVWRHNPDGVFAPAHPGITCPPEA